MEKIALIHRTTGVYYYYQSVYKLVYYNNKSENASKRRSLHPPERQEPIAAHGNGAHQFAWRQMSAAGSSPKPLPTAVPACVANASVEKPRHIHRTGCAEHGNFYAN